ncbi:MAG: DUF4105 domain-containing protein [Halopseudomonas sp.]|uniref:Lnb N-terminal periplasmic domain-containing protein n=1 Tax=Halopseudomonas sp. TaxID=2901191 RepID=UPI0030035AB5
MLLSLVLLLALLLNVWVILALWFHRPRRVQLRYLPLGLWLLIWSTSVLCLWRGDYLPAALWLAAGLAPVLLWWRGLLPTGQGDWADDVAYTTTGALDGDTLSLQRVREFRWLTREQYEPVWCSREYALSQLQTVDMITSFWGLRPIAHVLVSFGFADGRYLTFSVEIRRQKHEEFSVLGGFFKHFELNIVASEERDMVRVRTNCREGDAYLYRTRISAENGRKLLLGFVEAANTLAVEPRFYHTLKANCTTIVYTMAKRIHPELPLDYRLLLSGYLDEYVFARGGLQSGYSLAELRLRGRITDLARQAPDDASFSRHIREGVPGCTQAEQPFQK